jgi:hypothetical protein
VLFAYGSVPKDHIPTDTVVRLQFHIIVPLHEINLSRIGRSERTFAPCFKAELVFGIPKDVQSKLFTLRCLQLNRKVRALDCQWLNT